MVKFLKGNWHILCAVLLTGVVAVSLLYYSSFAKNTTPDVEEYSNLNLKVGNYETSLSVSDEDYYYNEDTGTLVFSKDAEFELSVESHYTVKVGLGVDDEMVYVDSHDTNKFLIKGVTNNTAITIVDADNNIYGTELSEYFVSKYPDMSSFVFASTEPSISVLNSNYQEGNYTNLDELKYDLEYSISEGLTLEDYELTIKFNDVVLSSENIKESDGVISVVIPIDNEEYALRGNEGSFNFSASLDDNVGGVSSVESTVMVDFKKPTVSSNVSYLIGKGDIIYLNNSNGSEFNFTVEDLGSGIYCVVAVDGEVENLLVGEGNNYSINLDSVSDINNLLFKIYDTCGNCKEVSILDIIGVEANSVQLGFPVVGFLHSVSGEEIEGWLKGSDASISLSLKDDCGVIDKVTGIINNENTIVFDMNSDTDSFEHTLSLNGDYTNGVVDLVLVAVYSDGVTEVRESLSFKVDKNAPVIEGLSVGSADAYNVYNGTAYLADDITISGTPKDLESGLDSVEILLNGKVVGNRLPYKVKDNGEYKIIVKDIVGNTLEYTLSELVGKEFSSIVISKSAPSISLIDFTDKFNDIEGYYWCKKVDGIGFSVLSDNLDNIKVSLNGGDYEYTDKGDSSYFIPLSDLSDGFYTLKITAKGMNGLSSNEEVKFYVDGTTPKIDKFEILGSYGYDSSNIYFKENLVFNVEVSDNMSDLTEFSLIDADGNKLYDIQDGTFTISDSGEYYIKAVDLIGNVSKVALKDLCGSTTNVFKLDNSVPVINYSIPDEGLGEFKNIYGSDVSFSIDMLDDTILKSYSVVCNDVEYKNDVGSQSSGYNFSTSNFNSNNGMYKIVITCEDIVGNIVSEELFVFVDTESPSVNSITINAEYLDRNSKLWFKSNPMVSIDANDNLVSVVEYIILNKDGSERSFNKGTTELIDGDYALKVKDNFGNVSEAKEFSSFLKTTNTIISVDNSLPIINYRKPTGGLSGWYSGDVDIESSIVDDNGIYSSYISINGNTLDYYSESEKGTNITLRANTKDADKKSDYSYTVVVYVEDNAGNISEYRDVVYVDTDKPEMVKAYALEIRVEKEYGVFFNTNPELNVTYRDKGVGLDKYILVDNKGEEVSSTDGKFTLTDGEYHLKVVDKLGNTSDLISLKDLLQLSSNSIVVDNTKPSIDCSRTEGDVNGWFNTDVVYKANVTDDKGIDYATLIINDVVVDSVKADKSSLTSFELGGSTYKVALPGNGTYEVVVKVVDNFGNTVEWKDVAKVDKNIPQITNFVVTNPGYVEGSTISGSDKYGLYLEGASAIDVYVDDGSASSGLSKLHYELVSSSGLIEKDSVKISGGVARVNIPANFKGYLKAYAVDNVGNTGKVARPDGIITGDSNTRINTSNINIVLPNTKLVDVSGLPLYAKDINVKFDIAESHSGLKKVTWGIGDETKGTLSIDNNGTVSGDINHSISGVDGNLIVALTSDVSIDKNENGIKLWVKVEDRLGRISENYVVFSIDKDEPIISVDYDTNVESNYYNTNRVATIKVVERNFSAKDVVFGGNIGTAGSWREDNGVWENTIVFDTDDDYEWSFDYKDLAGNKGNSYSSEKFTVDKTLPSIVLNFDNLDFENEQYYKEGRIATLTIVERNFDSSLVVFEGLSPIDSWSNDGDKHICTIDFNEDGIYNFTISATDKSGNVSNTVSSGGFIVDKTNPAITIEGVQNGISYKDSIGFSIRVDDTNIDDTRSVVRLSGRVNGDIALDGGFEGSVGTFTFKGVSEDKIFDDLYTLNIDIYDKSGNIIEETVVFSINRYGSDYIFLEEHMLNNIVNDVDTITLTETSVDRLDISNARIVVIRDGNVLSYDTDELSIEESGGVEGNWVYSYSVDESVFEEDGKYQVQVYSKTLDGSDNSSLKQEFAFILDSTDPEVIISGIESGKSYLDVSKNVTIDVRDLSGVEIIKAYSNGSEVDITSSEDGLYVIALGESSGRQELEVVVKDRAGNESTIKVDDFFITSSVVQSLLNNTLVRVLLVVVVGVVAWVVVLIIRKRNKDKVSELKSAEETVRMHLESSTESSSDSDDNE